MKLRQFQRYEVTYVYDDSNLADYAATLKGCLVSLAGENLPHSPAHLPSTRSATVLFRTGVFRDQVMQFTHFEARKYTPEGICRCKAYPFPHRAGSGKCASAESPYTCSYCGISCEVLTADLGIGNYEYGSIQACDRDLQTLSTCCHAAVNPRS